MKQLTAKMCKKCKKAT